MSSATTLNTNKMGFVTKRAVKELDKGYTVVLFPEARELTFTPAKIFSIGGGSPDAPASPEFDVECTPIGETRTYADVSAIQAASIINELDLRDGGVLVLFN